MLIKHPKRWLIIGVLVTALGVAGGSVFVYFGIYNISALEQHTPPVYRLLQYAMVRSVAARSEAEPPDLQVLDWQGRGLASYETYCQQCHGAPGVAPEEFSLGMVPAPTAIAEIARKREPPEIFWVIKHGIKMSGMPAWDYRLTEREMWEVVAFVKEVANLTVAEYRQLRTRVDASTVVADKDERQFDLPEERDELINQGRIALQQYNCTSCHVVPGITAGRNHVGPPLGGVTQRTFIAGVLENSPENLVRWIRFPQDIDPKTTMPNLGVSQAHAEEIAAYLRSLED